MNGWLFLLLAFLLFAPKSSSEKGSRWDMRALALLLCVIALMAQI